MIEIEFEPPSVSICECCGAVTTRLTRYVTEDGGAYAVYYACLADDQPDDFKAAVSVGMWGEGSTPADRTAFALRLWQNDAQFGVTVEDAADSPWRSVEMLGRMLDRSEALAHPRLKDVFHITDHIVADDPEVRAFFERPSPHHLFVYGTLRRAAASEAPDLLAGNAVHVGPATMRGRLFVVGEYAALVSGSHDEREVIGDLFRIDPERLDDVMRRLDAYEGCSSADPEPHDYRRQLVHARLPSGEDTLAWAYVLNRSPEGLDEIASGDYLAWRSSRQDDTTTLFRPVGPRELKLLEAGGWRRWPPRLPEQPIFYPVTNVEYATQIASTWNVRESGAGYVTRFRVRNAFMRQFEIHCVGAAHHTEWWIPAERLEELNDNIVGEIEVIASFGNSSVEPPERQP